MTTMVMQLWYQVSAVNVDPAGDSRCNSNRELSGCDRGVENVATIPDSRMLLNVERLRNFSFLMG